jgi:hypothetical protein
MEALDEASGDDQATGFAAGFVAGHFEDGIDGFLLGAGDEGAGIDDNDIGGIGVGSEFGSGLGEHTHHDLAIDEVFGATEAHESYLGRGRQERSRGCGFL